MKVEIAFRFRDGTAKVLPLLYVPHHTCHPFNPTRMTGYTMLSETNDATK